MRALSLRQPFASLCFLRRPQAEGGGVWKAIETRSWRTHFRGRIAIHASSTPIAPADLENPAFAAALAASGVNWGDLPQGCLLGTVSLLDCWRIVDAHTMRQFGQFGAGDADLLVSVPPAQRPFGIYAPGRWAWALSDQQAFAQPVPMPGRQGLWIVPERAAPPPSGDDLQAAFRRKLRGPI